MVFNDEEQLWIAYQNDEKFFLNEGAINLLADSLQTVDDEERLSQYDLQDIKKMAMIYYFTPIPDVLRNFDIAFLNDKSMSLTILNDINLIQDFAVQVNHLTLLSMFDQSSMVNLKDYVYNNHYWKGGDKNNLALKREEKKIKHLCNSLYTEFFESLA